MHQPQFVIIFAVFTGYARVKCLKVYTQNVLIFMVHAIISLDCSISGKAMVNRFLGLGRNGRGVGIWGGMFTQCNTVITHRLICISYLKVDTHQVFRCCYGCSQKIRPPVFLEQLAEYLPQNTETFSNMFLLTCVTFQFFYLFAQVILQSGMKHGLS